MRGSKIIFATLAASALLAASVSSADARWFGHRGGRGPGLIGGIIVGAATIATLPFALLGAAVNPGPRGYYDQSGYGPPPGSYSYGPPPGAYGYGPPPPPPRYYGNYGPPPGYYGGY
jgi:hypothetical protein